MLSGLSDCDVNDAGIVERIITLCNADDGCRRFANSRQSRSSSSGSNSKKRRHDDDVSLGMGTGRQSDQRRDDDEDGEDEEDGDLVAEEDNERLEELRALAKSAERECIATSTNISTLRERLQWVIESSCRDVAPAAAAVADVVESVAPSTGACQRHSRAPDQNAMMARNRTSRGHGGDTHKSKVWMGTIHRAKGLEWSVVLIVDATAECFGDSYDRTVEDERCAAYVALSRAKWQAIITYVGPFNQMTMNNCLCQHFSPLLNEPYVLKEMHEPLGDHVVDDGASNLVKIE